MPFIIVSHSTSKDEDQYFTCIKTSSVAIPFIIKEKEKDIEKSVGLFPVNDEYANPMPTNNMTIVEPGILFDNHFAVLMVSVSDLIQVLYGEKINL
jgi:hypothetical protein